MIDRLVIRHLLFTEEYGRKVLPYLKGEYFQRRADRVLFEVIGGYVNRYNSFPTREAVAVDLAALRGSGLSDEEFHEAIEFLKVAEPEKTEVSFLVDRTEQFCKDQAIYNAIVSSVSILEDKTGKLSRGAIPQMLADALSISFNTPIGHDFLVDAEDRYAGYHEKQKKVGFDLTMFNKITRGGFAAKTLNVWLAGVHVGKTFIMGHCAAANLIDMKNVLYITLEMSERQISERLDSNILKLPLHTLMTLDKDTYLNKIRSVAARTTGKLIVKEYPTASAGVGHFRHLVQELRIKRNFIPDIIYIDYLNICTSTRFKQDQTQNSYNYVKSIAEEARGLAVELDLPIVSATQLNRIGFKSSDPDMSDTSESFGTPATADFMAVVTNSDELQASDQLQFKQLKNRYHDLNSPKKFVLGIDRNHFRLYDVEQKAQDAIVQEPAVTQIAMIKHQKPSFNFGTLK